MLIAAVFFVFRSLYRSLLDIRVARCRPSSRLMPEVKAAFPGKGIGGRLA